MTITRKELDEIIRLKTNIERVATLSSDGRNLLIRIPKEVRESLGLLKGDKIKFFVDDKKKLTLDILQRNEKKKEENS